MVSGFALIATLLAFRGVYASASAVGSLPDGAKRLFEESMALNEHYWDDIDGYLYQVDTAGIHDTRATAMWAAALLARNDESSRDVSRAIRIIEQVLSQQYSDNSSAAWYGTFPHSPQDPFPGTSLLGNITYTTFDPNWRDFIGTAWLLAKEESGSLLPDSVVRDIEQSLYLVAKGQLLRYQGRGEYANSAAVQDSIEDNLDFAYTNPWLMGTIVMSYIGHKLNDTELIDKSNEDAQAVYDLFTFGGFNTFSEYNSGTYTGVDVWALALWIRYGPEGTNLKEYGTYMLERTMSDLADFYHPDLRNLAGPWDRTYGFDMTRYHSIIGQIISSFVSIDRHAVPSPPLNGLHINDGVVFGSLIPLVIDTVKSAVSDTTLAKFSTLSGDGTVHFRQVRTNTEDPTAIRNVTVWLGDKISIGGQSLDEPSPRQSSHVSGAIQWLLPSSLYNSTFTPTSLPKIGYIVVTPPMSGVVNATASANTLTVSLPPSSRWKNVTLPFSLNFAVGGFDMRSSNADMTKGLLGVPGLNIFVETVGLGEQSTSYDQTGENNFYFFNVSYPVTAKWPTIPSITITARAN